MDLPGTTTISVDRLAHLQALESNILAYLTAKRFPDMVLAKLRLQRMTGTANPKYLDETEAEWLKKKTEVDWQLRPLEPAAPKPPIRTRIRAAV